MSMFSKREHSCLCYCKPGKVSGPCYYEWTGKHLKEGDDREGVIQRVLSAFRADKRPPTNGAKESD